MCEHTDQWCDGLFPDDPDYCAQPWADSPWCAGPSMAECPSGIEVPETEACGTVWTNDTDALGAPPEASCEEDGTCDDSCSPPARGDCLTAEVTTPPHDVQLAELPATGAGVEALMLVSAAMIAVGTDLVCRRRKGRR